MSVSRFMMPDYDVPFGSQSSLPCLPSVSPGLLLLAASSFLSLVTLRSTNDLHALLVRYPFHRGKMAFFPPTPTSRPSPFSRPFTLFPPIPSLLPPFLNSLSSPMASGRPLVCHSATTLRGQNIRKPRSRRQHKQENHTPIGCLF